MSSCTMRAVVWPWHAQLIRVPGPDANALSPERTKPGRPGPAPAVHSRVRCAQSNAPTNAARPISMWTARFEFCVFRRARAARAWNHQIGARCEEKQRCSGSDACTINLFNATCEELICFVCKGALATAAIAADVLAETNM